MGVGGKLRLFVVMSTSFVKARIRSKQILMKYARLIIINSCEFNLDLTATKNLYRSLQVIFDLCMVSMQHIIRTVYVSNYFLINREWTFYLWRTWFVKNYNQKALKNSCILFFDFAIVKGPCSFCKTSVFIEITQTLV